MSSTILIIFLVAGDALIFKTLPGKGCHETFDKLTYSKSFKTKNGNPRIGTFYLGKQVLAYRCE